MALSNSPSLSLTRLLRACQVRPLNGWKSRSDSVVNDIYWYRSAANDFGQGPMRSPSVFNFFMPDHIPSNNGFQSQNLVSPELELLTGEKLLGLHNVMHNFLFNYEANRIKQKKTIAAAATKSAGSNHLLLLNYDDELKLMRQHLGSDYSKVSDSQIDAFGFTAKERAAQDLITFCMVKLSGHPGTTAQQAALTHYLSNGSPTAKLKGKDAALYMISECYRFLGCTDHLLCKP